MARGRPRKIDPAEALGKSVMLFWEKGYDGTSMNDLSEATGMAKPGLYACFGDKEALFEKALDYYLETYGTGVVDTLTTDKPVADVVCAFLTIVADASFNTDFPGGCFYVNSLSDCHHAPQSHQERLKAVSAGRLRRLVAVFDAAKANGELDPSADSEQLAGFYTGQTIAIATLASSGESRALVDGLIRVALDALPLASKSAGQG